MKYFGAFFLTLLLVPSFALAQQTPNDALAGLSDNIAVTVSPENPGPNTSVTVNVDSYATDLNSARITWSVNGKILQDGMGKKSLTLTTGSLGSATTINLTIVPLNGASFQKTITLTPASVDLFWQANSYTPPFYEGKAQFAKQNSITFVAVPNIVDAHGNRVSISNAIYTWSKDGSVMGSLSGTGKNTLTLTDSILGLPMSISVSVSTLDQSITATKSLSLQSQNPLILLYENNPLYGILYNRELGNTFNLSEAEVSVTGAPYYFSNSDESAGRLQYSWSINGAPVASPNQNSITLRQQTGVAGNSVLGLQIQNSNIILQNAQTQSTIQFGQ